MGPKVVKRLIIVMLLTMAALGSAAGEPSEAVGACPCTYLGVGVPWSEYSDPVKLSALVDGKMEEYILVDVRERGEYEMGHIRTAINIPLGSIAATPPSERKDALIIVYCKSGNRSAKAAETLKSLGYTGIVDFGGVGRWTEPLETGSPP
jgi:rhodanese-related sulfurtransferase